MVMITKDMICILQNACVAVDVTDERVRRTAALIASFYSLLICGQVHLNRLREQGSLSNRGSQSMSDFKKFGENRGHL